MKYNLCVYFFPLMNQKNNDKKPQQQEHSLKYNIQISQRTSFIIKKMVGLCQCDSNPSMHMKR